MTRGSRKHVLDWTDQPRFVPEHLGMVKPVECRVTVSSVWQPMGNSAPRAARLEQFGPAAIPQHPAWPALALAGACAPRRRTLLIGTVHSGARSKAGQA